MAKRIGYLDIARGIGILLVVLGHNDFEAFSPLFHQIIYSFHVPLFFFLSGYFINISLAFPEYFGKRFHSVLKPYLFTILLIYFASVSFEKMGFQTALGRIVKALYGSFNYIDWGQLWFLPNLFVVSLYAFLFIRATGRLGQRWVRWGILLLTLAIALPFLDTFYPFSVSVFGKAYELYGLPLSLDLILVNGFFFILGSETRQVTSEGRFDHVLLLLAAGMGLIALNLLFPYSVDVARRIYQSFFVNTLEAILGILFILALSRQIELHTPRLAGWLKYFGDISLIILIFHIPIQDAWGQKILGVTNHLPLAILIGFIMGVLGPALIHEIFIRFNPVAAFWFGRKAEAPQPKEAPSAKEQTIAHPEGSSAVEIKEP